RHEQLDEKARGRADRGQHRQGRGLAVLDAETHDVLVEKGALGEDFFNRQAAVVQHAHATYLVFTRGQRQREIRAEARQLVYGRPDVLLVHRGDCQPVARDTPFHAAALELLADLVLELDLR